MLLARIYKLFGRTLGARSTAAVGTGDGRGPWAAMQAARLRPRSERALGRGIAACRRFGVASAWWAVVLFGPVPAAAQITVQAFGPAPGDDVVSVGDPLTVIAAAQLGGLLPQLDLTYTYLVSTNATYIPNSVTIGGAPVADTDNRIEVGSGYVRIALGSAGPGALAITLRLRAMGAIGAAIEHTASIGALLSTQQTLRGIATRIEDERASLVIAPVVADSRLNGAQPTWNYGGAGQVTLSNQVAAEQRAVLRFDLTGVALTKDEVVAGRVEFWPTYHDPSPATVNFFRVRRDWSEGSQNGAICTGGVTWKAPNCSDSWVAGGDHEAAVEGTAVVAAQASYASADISTLVREWVDGGRPNQGVEAIASGIPAGSTLAHSSKEGATFAAPAARLSIVAAPVGAYGERAMKSAIAEIRPTQVASLWAGQRFVYSVLPTFEAASTGVNRIHITVPSGFSAVAVDSVRAHGLWLQRNADAVLSDTEFEVWPTAGEVDVRIAPAVTLGSLSQLVQVVFHASTPAVTLPTRFDFPADLDHDRLGYPPQVAQQGNANGTKGDGDGWRVTVVPADVTGLVVAPADTTVPQGYVIAYRAWAVMNGGARVDATDQVLWSVAPPALAEFVGGGVLHTLQQGVGAVSATLGTTLSAPAPLRVDPPVLKELLVEPAAARLPVGATRSFSARGFYSSGDTLGVTLTATWAAGDSSIARVIGPGQLRGMRAGSTYVTASLDGVVSPATPLDVTPAELVAVSVAPADTTVALGFSVPMHAFGTYTDGRVAEVTGVASWTATPPGIADVGADGVATTLAVGMAAVVATLDGVASAPAGLHVAPPALVQLDGSPDGGAVPAGVVHHVQSKGLYSDGSTADLTAQVIWQSLDPLVATFLSAGNAYAVGPGTARLVHALGGVHGDTLSLQVTPALLDSVTVAPASALLPPGAALPMAATAHFSDGSAADVTSQSAWNTSAPAVATVDTNGVVITLADGVASITANFGGHASLPSLVQVTATALDSLVIAPADTTLPLGRSLRYAAMGWAGGAPYDLTSSVSWSSADTSVAAIGPRGWAHSRGQGTTAIGASLGGVLAPPVSLHVAPPAVVALEVTPATASVLLWRTKALQATATMTDGQSLDVTALASWESDAPSVVYADASGLAVALSLGTAHARATWQSVISTAATITVLPSVRAEALTIGTVAANPGSADRLLLTLRLDNAYLQVRGLSALRVSLPDALGAVLPFGPNPEPEPVGPNDNAFTALRLLLDDGDGVFEPSADTVLANGVPSGGTWTASNLTLQLPVGGSRTLFVSGDVSLTHVAHQDILDLRLTASAHLFWSLPTALVAPAGFPLNSVGQVMVRDLVAAQIAFTAAPSDTVHPGQTGVPLLTLVCPDDGGTSDVLDELRVRQVGSARAQNDLQRLRLQTLVGGDWEAVRDGFGDPVDLVPTGGPVWVASGLGLSIPAGGCSLRVVGDLADGAEQARTLQLQLPALGMGFDSGRLGPVDAGWTNPGSMVIDIIPTLHVRAYSVQSPAQPVARHARRLPVLGIELQAQTASADTLLGLQLAHTSVGPGGPASDPDAQIESAELWLDRNGNGAVDEAGSGTDDVLLEQLPGVAAGTLAFGSGSPLALVLPPAQPLRLLVALTPDSTGVRDAERLSVRLDAPADVVVRGLVAVDLSSALSTEQPPIIDGQGVAGYSVRPVEAHLVYAGTRGWPVMDLALPANGLETDVLEGLRIENSGTATAADISAVSLWRDDGDGVLEATDLQVAALSPVAARAWEATGLAEALPAGVPARYWVTIDLAQNPQPGATFTAAMPRNGVMVGSGNDGPYDFAAAGGGPAVVAVADRVTWVAGVAGAHQVRPDAQSQAVLVLEGFNGYLAPRSLISLQVSVLGSAAPIEYGAWGLFHDANRNGILDRSESEAPLAIATDNAGAVHFEGFRHDLPPLQQDRLFVAYSLAFGSARDGSTVDAVVPSASSFGYQDDGGTPTTSAGDFNLDSPGQDTVDGMILAQVPGAGVPSRTLGAGESSVLALNRLFPSNGWEPDTLQQLEVQLVDFGPGQTALMGDDIEALRLWAETDPSGAAASFDPAQDQLVASLVGGQAPLRFTGLSESIPVAGRRFYVTADVGPAPGDGHKLRLRVPVDAIQMASGNDGPIDGEILGSATHRISASTLLVEIDASPDMVSRGQSVDVRVAVRNQGSQQLAGVLPLLIQASPAAGAVLASGPLPPTLDLAAGQADTIVYRFTLGELGEVVFSTQVGTADSAVVSDLATSGPVRVQSPPTALLLQPIASLPVSVNRGQSGVTPLAWQLAHAQPDTVDAAAVAVRSLTLDFDDGAGAPIPASSAIDHLAIRTGSLVHASWDAIPAQSQLAIALDPPIVLAPGQSRSLPLEVSIAPGASAGRFRLSLSAPPAAAVDVNSAAPVAVQAPSPWHTSAAYIRTLATRVEVDLAAMLPPTANAAQLAVPAGRLTLSLPGAAGESEASVVELALAVRDTAAVPLDPAAVFSALRVRSGGTVLASVVAFDAPGGMLRVPLSIPRSMTSGAPEALDLEVDLRSAPTADRFQIVVPDSSALVVQDANTGANVPAFAVGGELPVRAGPAVDPAAGAVRDRRRHVDVPARGGRGSHGGSDRLARSRGRRSGRARGGGAVGAHRTRGRRDRGRRDPRAGTDLPDADPRRHDPRAEHCPPRERFEHRPDVGAGAAARAGGRRSVGVVGGSGISHAGPTPALCVGRRRGLPTGRQSTRPAAVAGRPAVRHRADERGGSCHVGRRGADRRSTGQPAAGRDRRCPASVEAGASGWCGGGPLGSAPTGDCAAGSRCPAAAGGGGGRGLPASRRPIRADGDGRGRQRGVRPVGPPRPGSGEPHRPGARNGRGGAARHRRLPGRARGGGAHRAGRQRPPAGGGACGGSSAVPVSHRPPDAADAGWVVRELPQPLRGRA